MSIFVFVYRYRVPTYCCMSTIEMVYIFFVYRYPISITNMHTPIDAFPWASGVEANIYCLLIYGFVFGTPDVLASFLDWRRALQVVIAMIITLAGMRVLSGLQPYRQGDENNLAEASLWVTFLTL